MVEFEVINLEEKKNRLVVTIKIADQIQSFGFPLSFKDTHALSKSPQWMHKIKEILEKHYALNTTQKSIAGKTKFIKKKFNTNNILDLSNTGLALIRREAEKSYDGILPDTKLKVDYDKIEEKLKLKRDKRRKKLNDAKMKLLVQNKSKSLKHCEGDKCNL